MRLHHTADGAEILYKFTDRYTLDWADPASVKRLNDWRRPVLGLMEGCPKMTVD